MNHGRYEPADCFEAPTPCCKACGEPKAEDTDINSGRFAGYVCINPECLLSVCKAELQEVEDE